MHPIRTDDIQPLLFGILEKFSSFCEENDLRFFLCAGTLLGAVRHKGFIPWDDDIDVGMLWDSYSALLELAAHHPYIDSEHRYRILLPVESPNIYPFIKVIDEATIAYERNIDRKYATSLWIDVFCFIGCPPTEKGSQRHGRKLARLRSLNQIMICGNIKDSKYKKLYPLTRMAKPLLKIGNPDEQKFAKKMVELERRNTQNTSFVGDIVWRPVKINRFPIDYFSKLISLEFEGAPMPCPHKYDEFLTQMYGDYMQLPPEDQRIRHNFEAYYRM